MNKQIVIDQDACIGCGICADTCQHSVIEMIDGKAHVMHDDYCDGLGNCLPVCPVDAIRFEEKESAAKSADEHSAHTGSHNAPAAHQGCPGSQAGSLKKKEAPTASVSQPADAVQTQLAQWPVQIKLAPVNAPFFEQADLLIAADCSAFSYGNFHNDFMKDKITLIGCPKLDDGDYSEKLTAILANNNVHSVTVVRMEVPCCGGLEHAVIEALKNCGKMIPWQVVTLSTDGRVVDPHSNQSPHMPSCPSAG